MNWKGRMGKGERRKVEGGDRDSRMTRKRELIWLCEKTNMPPPTDEDCDTTSNVIKRRSALKRVKVGE